MTSPLFCCDELRRAAIRGVAGINGIDWLEVIDHDEPDINKRQRFLKVHFVNPPVWAIGPANVVVEGGERIRRIDVVAAQIVAGVLEVEVDPRGDFSPYVLRLVPSSSEALAGLDPALSEIEFSFKVECETELDCRDVVACPPAPAEEPRIDYLAKDYASFRRLMLDRMSLLAPRWNERNPADLGVALVEMLAYVADHLSYQQDAVATEAYLRTARLRTSVRRHARLVDYRLYDGCNARVFVHFPAGAQVTVAKGTRLLTRIEALGPRVDPVDLPRVLTFAPEVFETMHAVDIFVLHNALPLHAWSSRNCCLPKGSTRATLRGHFPDLHRGDLLLFEEITGPRTGEKADADPAHRHVVRLTDVQPTQDPAPESGAPVDITEVRWADDDALPFPLCVSATTDEAHGNRFIDQVSVARGNVALADHGLTILDESLGAAPEPALFRPAPEGVACDFEEPVAIAPRFRPRLKQGPLTQQARTFNITAPASQALAWRPDDVLPFITLTTVEDGALLTWQPQADLFESDDTTRDFVAEVEEDGLASIRFGDDDYGRRPQPGLELKATYRAGNGTAGNVGAQAIAHVVTTDAGIGGVRNPLPARGGVDPEMLEHARQSAPEAFRVQERAVTEEDYAEVTMRRPGIDRAAATFRWTGSWYTLFDTVDRIGNAEVDEPFRRDTRAFLERYRVVGHDIEVDAPRFVALDIVLSVCVEPEYFRADVKRELLGVFRRFFDPDNFTFGQSVYLSRLVAAAQSVEGVDSVTVLRFRRRGFASSEAKDTGELMMGRLEVARLDDNPDFPERGRLTLDMRGGR